MSDRLVRNLTVGFVVLLLALAISRCERVEEPEWVEATGEAATNSFWATSLLFEERGLEVYQPVGWYDLPPTDFTLMLLLPRYSTTPDRVERLLAWVEEGGHLVVAPDSAFNRDRWDGEEWLEDEEQEGDDEPQESDETEFDLDQDPLADDEGWLDEASDPLLDALGVEVLFDLDLSDEGTSIVLVESGRGTHRVDIWALPGLQDGQGRAEFATGAITEASGHALLRYRLSEGAVTVIQDVTVLENDQIDVLDHARFAYDLASPPQLPRRGVWMVHRDRFPSVFTLLREHAAHAVLAGLVLLFAWLWRRGVRFGPLERPPQSTRRSLLEHVEAVGQLLWRTKKQGALIEATRDAFERTARRRDPALGPQDRRARIARLAERADMKPSRLANALEADPQSTDFLATVSTLEEARRTLAARSLGGAAATAERSAAEPSRSQKRSTETER